MSDLDLKHLIECEENFGSPLVGRPKYSSSENILSLYTMFSEGKNSALLKEMTNRGHLRNGYFGLELIDFTSHLNSTSHRSLFRSSANLDVVPVSAAFQLWLGALTSQANTISELYGLNYNADDMSAEFIRNVAQMSRDHNSVLNLQQVLLEKNIVLVFEPGLEGMKTDGVFLVLPNGVPVIGLTLRFSRVDYFWYTLLHELSHLQLHYNLDADIFSDDTENHDFSADRAEIQADRLALNSIVPRAYWRRTQAFKRRNAEGVLKTADEFNVHPALIAGRLRREFNLYKDKELSDIVNNFDIRKLLYGG